MTPWMRLTALLVTPLIATASTRVALAQPAPSLPPGYVLVHVDSPDPVNLERETGDDDKPFYVLCTSPCDAGIPATGGYRIAGEGLRDSSRFELAAKEGRETVSVSPASRFLFGLGIAAIAAGQVSAALGVATFLAPLGGEPGDRDTRPLGLALLAGGLAATAGGIVLVVMNRRSRIQQTFAAGPPVKLSSALFPSDVTPRSAPIQGYPTATSCPLFQITF